MQGGCCTRTRAYHGPQATPPGEPPPHEPETATLVLADLEHVLRLPGHPVRVRPAERQRQPDLPDPRRGRGADPAAVDRRAADRAGRAADRRLFLRPHLDPARPSPAVLPVGRGVRLAGIAGDAE